MVVVCALRDTESPAVSGLLVELARLGTAWLRLDALTTEDVAEVLAARGESRSASASEEPHRRSEGTPFVLGELLRLPPAKERDVTEPEPVDLASLATHARQKQDRLSDVQADMAALEAMGHDGGGLVTATVSGKGRPQCVRRCGYGFVHCPGAAYSPRVGSFTRALAV